MTKRLRRLLPIALLAALILIPIVFARGDDEPVDDKARAADALQLALRAAETYRFFVAESRDSLVPQPEPLLTWTNPVLGEVYGDVFVWTAKGRPEMIASFVKWYHPFTHRTHEFQSLSLGPVVGERSGEKVWNCTRPGTELTTFPGAPEPASTPGQRLRQMRDLARQFTGRQTDLEHIERDMRLLAKPLYRYEKTEGDLIDGALFAFALGTDPDAILMIEDRVVDGKPSWKYALARMTAFSMRISLQGREVWTAEFLPHPLVAAHTETYTTFRYNHGNDPSRP